MDVPEDSEGIYKPRSDRFFTTYGPGSFVKQLGLRPMSGRQLALLSCAEGRECYYAAASINLHEQEQGAMSGWRARSLSFQVIDTARPREWSVSESVPLISFFFIGLRVVGRTKGWESVDVMFITLRLLCSIEWESAS